MKNKNVKLEDLLPQGQAKKLSDAAKKLTISQFEDMAHSEGKKMPKGFTVKDWKTVMKIIEERINNGQTLLCDSTMNLKSNSLTCQLCY